MLRTSLIQRFNLSKCYPHKLPKPHKKLDFNIIVRGIPFLYRVLPPGQGTLGILVNRVEPPLDACSKLLVIPLLCQRASGLTRLVRPIRSNTLGITLKFAYRIPNRSAVGCVNLFIEIPLPQILSCGAVLHQLGNLLWSQSSCVPHLNISGTAAWDD